MFCIIIDTNQTVIEIAEQASNIYKCKSEIETSTNININLYTFFSDSLRLRPILRITTITIILISKLSTNHLICLHFVWDNIQTFNMCVLHS